MTTEKLHEILDDENRELTIEELCQVLYELKTDCFQKYSEEFEANKIPTSQFYLGEQNAFQICLDLMEHIKSSEIKLLNKFLERFQELCIEDYESCDITPDTIQDRISNTRNEMGIPHSEE